MRRRGLATSRGWCRDCGNSFFVIPARGVLFVIPAKAGIHFDFIGWASAHRLVLSWCSSRKPTHVPVFFRPPSWRSGHFLLLVQEKVTKENTPSVPRLRCAKVRYGRPGFCQQAILGLRQKRRDPSRRPRERGLIRPPFAASQRDRRAKALGPHFRG